MFSFYDESIILYMTLCLNSRALLLVSFLLVFAPHGEALKQRPDQTNTARL
jgi:hypothetical protein